MVINFVIKVKSRQNVIFDGSFITSSTLPTCPNLGIHYSSGSGNFGSSNFLCLSHMSAE